MRKMDHCNSKEQRQTLGCEYKVRRMLEKAKSIDEKNTVLGIQETAKHILKIGYTVLCINLYTTLM